MSKDTELLNKLNAAVGDLNAADQTVVTAQADVVAKAKVVGTLLLEARKVHKGLAFNEFLKRVDGLQRSRAYDYMKMVGGRKADDEIKQAIEADRKEKRERKRKNRADQKKLPPPASETVSDDKPDWKEARRKANAQWQAEQDARNAGADADQSAASDAGRLKITPELVAALEAWRDADRALDAFLRAHNGDRTRVTRRAAKRLHCNAASAGEQVRDLLRDAEEPADRKAA